MREFFNKIKGENTVRFIVLAAWVFSAVGGFIFACCKGNFAANVCVVVLIVSGVPYVRKVLKEFLEA